MILTPLVIIAIGAFVIHLITMMVNSRASKQPQPTAPLLPHHEWWDGLQTALSRLTLATIDSFDPGSVPITRMHQTLDRIDKRSNSFGNINFTPNEIRQQHTAPVYLYEKYDTDYAEVEVDQLLDSARTFKIGERGVGKPIAVKVGASFRPYDSEDVVSIWKCTTHDNIRMKTVDTPNWKMTPRSIAEKFKCSECELEKRDPSLALKRMGVQPVVPGRWDAKYIEQQNRHIEQLQQRKHDLEDKVNMVETFMSQITRDDL